MLFFPEEVKEVLVEFISPNITNPSMLGTSDQPSWGTLWRILISLKAINSPKLITWVTGELSLGDHISTHVSHKFKCSDLPTAAMAGQLNSFVQKFYSLWNTGNDARLNLECHAGKAQFHLVQLSSATPPARP
jgi:hypothetical protein